MARKRPLHLLLCILAAFLVAMSTAPAPAVRAADCQIVLGFDALKTLIENVEGPGKVGECLENARFSIVGDASQRTTGGLLVWRKADNWTGFTDGYRTWVVGPRGLQTRLNTRRFSWEIASVTAQSLRDASQHTIFQVSPISALLEGAYDGVMTIGDLRKRGDFGLGTFDRLDGEMVVLDGVVYQVRSDGAVYSVDNAMTTPFATVTFFNPVRSANITQSISLDGLEAYLDRLLPTKNIPYAIRIEGELSYVKARSVPKQDKPYPRLADVTATQPTFEYYDVEGTLVVLRFPSYMEGINVPGYHFHFLSKDRKAGGHVLDGTIQNAFVQIDDAPNFQMDLPQGGDFFSRRELGRDDKGEFQGVEN